MTGFDSTRPLTEHPEAPGFAAELQDEHFDAIGFLLGHREAWAEDPAVGWRETVELERRIDAHHRALVVAGRAACAHAATRLMSDEPETALGALHLLATTPTSEVDLGAALAEWEPERRAAAVDALVYRSTPAVLDALLRAAAPGARAIGAWTCARTGTGDGKLLEALLGDGDAEVQAGAALALAMLARKGVAARIEALLSGEPAHQETLAHAFLLLLGEPARDALWRVAQRGPPSLLAVAKPLALAGDPRVATPLEATLATECTPVAIAALGVLGHPASVVAILGAWDALVTPELEHAAVEALTTITGIRVATVDGEGEPIAIDPAPWQAWAGSQPARHARMRLGAPWTPRACLDELLAVAAPRHARTRAAAELALALGPTGFDPVASVDAQERALATWTSRIGGQGRSRR